MDTTDDHHFIIDFTFIHIEHELWALGELLPILEQQMPLLANQQSKNSFEELRREGIIDDDAERDNASYMADHFADEVLPRLLRGPYLLSLWSVVDSAINDAAKRLERKLSKPLSLRDIRGKNDLDQAQKYFEYILQFPLWTDTTTYDALDRFRILRNAFAHANGRITLVKQDDQSLLKKWADAEKSITIVDEFLVPSGQYVKAIYTLINAWIRDLHQRARPILNG